MKKGLFLFTLSVILAVSGYSQSNDSQQVKAAQAVVENSNQEPDYSQSSTVAISEPIAVDEDACDTCDDEVAEKKEPVNCAKEVKVVRYNDKCRGGCGFPVTVRIASNCPNEGVE